MSRNVLTGTFNSLKVSVFCKISEVNFEFGLRHQCRQQKPASTQKVRKLILSLSDYTKVLNL